MSGTIEALAQLANAAACDYEASRGRGDYDTALELKCAGVGIMLLGELGAHRIDAHDGDVVGVTIGGDAIEGARIVAPFAALLDRLGWRRDESFNRASYEPLLMVYMR